MSTVLAYSRHRFEQGVVQISAERNRGRYSLRLALKRLNGNASELVDVVALIYPKKHPKAASAVVDKLQESDFERAYALLLEEFKRINKVEKRWSRYQLSYFNY